MFEPVCIAQRWLFMSDYFGKTYTVNQPHKMQMQEYDPSERANIYFNNLFWYALFFLQHTGMKKKVFKQSIFPVSERLERSLYVLTASIAYHMTFKMQQPLPYVLYNIENKWFMFWSGLLSLFGTFFCLWSTFVLDHWSFCGITQAYAKKPKNLPFGRVGIYGIIRHPQYLGQLLAYWSRPMMTEGDLLWALSMTLYIFIAVQYSEEPALIELIGEDYVTYTQEVPAYCPVHLPGCFCSRKTKGKDKIQERIYQNKNQFKKA